MSSLLTIVFSLLALFVPVVLCCFIFVYFKSLKDFEKIFGAFYIELHSPRGRIVILTKFIYFLRRIAIGASVIYCNNIVVQMLVMYGFSLAQIMNICYIRPYADGRPKNFQEICNEVFIILISYTMICFTDFAQSIQA